MSDPVFSHDDSIEISASPEAVYALVSNMARYGEWSPQNVGGEWLDGGNGTVGDWFEGRNKAGKMEWTAKAEITEASPGQEFGFWTMGKEANVVHWRYSMEPAGNGTKLNEHYRLYNPPEQIAKGGEAALQGWCEGVKANISTMLANIKASAEG
ncbi:MAG: SRPBCC family protein [Acidimicrobiales bacterium]